jgi:hypothetical protein
VMEAFLTPDRHGNTPRTGKLYERPKLQTSLPFEFVQS